MNSKQQVAKCSTCNKQWCCHFYLVNFNIHTKFWNKPFFKTKSAKKQHVN